MKVEQKMFYGATPKLFEYARRLRENMTHAEKLVWEELKENKTGVRFKAQHPIDIFIADFYSHEIRLIVEIDGGIHGKQADYDLSRTEELKNFSIHLIRFSNEDVINVFPDVLQKIKVKIEVLKSKQNDKKIRR